MNKIEKQDKNENNLISPEIDKRNYSNISLEVTRMCNLSCTHCLCGEPENIQIKKETIDILFSQIDVLANLSLTGGEPFLEPELIDYIVNTIIDKGIKLYRFQAHTNGTILNENIANSFNKISSYIIENCTIKDLDIEYSTCLIISDDEFHNNKDFTNTALQYYRKICGDDVFVALKSDAEEDNYHDLVWTYTGRSFENMKEGYKYQMPVPEKHQIHCDYDQYGNIISVHCPLLITVYGNVCVDHMYNFYMRDKVFSVGNIYKSALHDMILKHNKCCFRTCKEVDVLQVFKTSNYLGVDLTNGNGDLTFENQKRIVETITHLIFSRKSLSKKFPYITGEEITDYTCKIMECKSEKEQDEMALEFLKLNNLRELNNIANNFK